MNTAIAPHSTVQPVGGGSAKSGSDDRWCTLCVVSTTVGSETAATQLARLLVTEKVAGCVQVQAITSHFIWQDQVQESAEWRLICKTLPDVLARLSGLLRSHHDYEVPQITMRTERCLQDYSDWLKQQVRI